MLVAGFDERETGVMPVRPPPPPVPVGKVTPPAPTVDVLGGVTPSAPLFNRSDGTGVAEPSSGAVLPPAALLRWFAELVPNGSTGLTGLTGLTDPVVSEGPPPAEGVDARDTGVPPPFSKSDGVRDEVPAVGNVLLGTAPGLRAACISGFSFPGFNGVTDGVVDGVVDGSGESTGVEANLVDLIGVLGGNVIRVGFGTDAFVEEFTREVAGPFTGVEANLVGVSGVLVDEAIRVGVVSGTFTGTLAGRFPRGLVVFTGEFTAFRTGVVTAGVFGSVTRVGVGDFVCAPGPRLMGVVVRVGRVALPTVGGGVWVLVCGSVEVPGGDVRFGVAPLSGDVMFVAET
ncbi:hypothetical protein ACI2L1_33870 [Streptomyces sp. NPDC019531]|uniref:hypothetical protein n=1 Tax=Streptomyces sp. NPDC019531 TaxID=3365062 RepID=UPI00384DB05A